jgi:hypothetical protein
MPDGHSGYGFPVGGVAAMDVDQGGVISPRGSGFDINCGMRLVLTNLTACEVRPHLKHLVDNSSHASQPVWEAPALCGARPGSADRVPTVVPAIGMRAPGLCSEETDVAPMDTLRRKSADRTVDEGLCRRRQQRQLGGGIVHLPGVEMSEGCIGAQRSHPPCFP